MAAPQIPNLNTLLRGRGGRGRARGRGRGGVASASGHGGSDSVPDEIVQRTDDDASGSRMSAVELGYLHDPFARAFFDGKPVRRYPIMNRGTYVRTTAIDRLVDRFLDSQPDQPKQIVSLGAGSDTRYFRILSRRAMKNLVYHEIDFPSNTAKKIAALRQSPSHLSTLQSVRDELDEDPKISADGSSFLSPAYNIHALDLRALAGESVGEEGQTTPSTLPNLSPSTPTLLLSECCLIYLPPAAAESIVKTFVANFIPSPTPLALIIYEPIRPNDAFGRVMVSNLATRGIHLQTLKRYSSLFRQKQRLKLAGFSSGCQASDVDFLWGKWVSNTEKERVAGLEMMDELEEWQLLAQHYCVAWGWRSGNEEEGKVFSEAWEALEAQDSAPDDDEGG